MQALLLPIEKVLFEVLKWLQGFVGDWGLAIILLTVIVRLLLTPLTWKQTKSMYELQRVQPLLKQLQEKYKNDKEKLQEETLKFYQEHKVNPLGGCLPLILQMPIFFALYRVLGYVGKAPGMLLQYVSDLGQVARFWFIIPDIAKTPKSVFMPVFQTAGFFPALWVALPYLILVVLFGLSIWLPQALMPGERSQKMIGLYMAVFMLYFGWISPTGVLLYWVTSSIWGIAQQQITLGWMKRSQPVLATAGAAIAGSNPKGDKQPKPKSSGQKSGKGQK